MFGIEKEEFSRDDPDSYNRFYWLAAVNWILPIALVIFGLFRTTQKFAAMMNYDVNVVGQPMFTLPSGYRIYDPLVFIMGILKYAFNESYSYYFFQAAPPLFISLILAALVFLITGLLVNSHQKNQHIHGTARWATRKDLEDAGHLQRYGVVCGELSNARIYSKINLEKGNPVLHIRKSLLTRKEKIAPLVCHSGATNTWMIAPTRSGKGVSVIMPTCLNYGVPYYVKVSPRKKEIEGRGSLVVFDPKGENYECSAGYRSKFSIVIPFRPLDEKGETAHYNPIHEIPDNPSTAYAWADMIGEIFFGADNAKSAGDGATQYFNNTARDIFTGVVLHVRFAPESLYPWEKKNMSTVLSVFSTEDEKEDGEQDDEGGSTGEEMLKEMMETDHGNELINELIRKAAIRSKKQNGKERASTYSTVFSKISLFQDPLIAQATAYSDFSIDDFINGKNGISLYLIVPYNHIKRIAPVFRMLITFMIKKFSDGTTNANSVKLKNHCLFLLDEFPVLGYFPDIALNAGILAGYGVTFFIVSQSINQIVDVYGENHPFLDHCKTKIVFAPGNYKDASNIAQTIGNRSVLLDQISGSGSKFQMGFNSVSRSSQETSVSLINPDELMKLEVSRAIILIEGRAPYKGKKVVYYEDPRFKHIMFMKIPEFNTLFKSMRTLPSNHVVHKTIGKPTVEQKIEKLAAIDINEMIPSDFDLGLSKGV